MDNEILGRRAFGITLNPRQVRFSGRLQALFVPAPPSGFRSQGLRQLFGHQQSLDLGPRQDAQRLGDFVDR